MRQLTFKNASEAFDFYYGTIPYEGEDFAGTRAMFNQGFTIEKPWERMIENEKHEFNMDYAEAEFAFFYMQMVRSLDSADSDLKHFKIESN